MNGMNLITYLLLALFVAGTSYVTFITLSDMYNDCARYLRALKRLLRITHRVRSFSEKVIALFAEPHYAGCCKSDKSTNKDY